MKTNYAARRQLWLFRCRQDKSFALLLCEASLNFHFCAEVYHTLHMLEHNRKRESVLLFMSKRLDLDIYHFHICGVGLISAFCGWTLKKNTIFCSVLHI
jgi:hypothetical protein